MSRKALVPAVLYRSRGTLAEITSKSLSVAFLRVWHSSALARHRRHGSRIPQASKGSPARGSTPPTGGGAVDTHPPGGRGASTPLPPHRNRYPKCCRLPRIGDLPFFGKAWCPPSTTQGKQFDKFKKRRRRIYEEASWWWCRTPHPSPMGFLVFLFSPQPLGKAALLTHR